MLSGHGRATPLQWRPGINTVNGAFLAAHGLALQINRTEGTAAVASNDTAAMALKRIPKVPSAIKILDLFAACDAHAIAVSSGEGCFLIQALC